MREPLLAACVLAGLVACASSGGDVEPHRPALLPNLHRLDDRVISGGVPAGEPAFAELAAMGVRTVISIPAGLAGIPRHIFYIWSVLGSAIWILCLASAGYQCTPRIRCANATPSVETFASSRFSPFAAALSGNSLNAWFRITSTDLGASA